MSQVKNKFVHQNVPFGMASDQHKMVQTMRENMRLTNFKMGSIVPEHRKVELRASSDIGAGKAVTLTQMSTTAR